jgi:tetratricopeptide (TPR) repeat protein
MHPVFKNNDSPETTAAVFTLGIGHPPGYPLFALAAKIFTLVPAANPAFRVNIFSVFLSMMVLIQAFLGMLKVTALVKRPEDPVTPVYALCILPVVAFSLIFWNQAIEAKGGIYMLNLLFFSAVVNLWLDLNQRFHIRYFYMGAFIYGLSLSNHWPSMIILMPVLLYYCAVNFKRLKPRRIAAIVFFFLAGLSAYIYLPIRAAAGPVLDWGNPVDLKSVIWVILRKGYAGPMAPSTEAYMYMIREYVMFSIRNYSILLLLAAAGAAVVFKRSRRDFIVLASAYILIVGIVVFYNVSKKDVLWIMDIFLMPAQYVLALFMAAGLKYLWDKTEDTRAKTVLAAAIVAAFAFMASSNSLQDNNSGDYLSYDYGKNILKTMPEGSLYIPDGDYNAMPVYYIQEIEGKRKDIKFIAASFLIFQWGVDFFQKQYGAMDGLKAGARSENVKKIVDKYAGTGGIFISNYFQDPIGFDARFNRFQDGLLTRLSTSKPDIDASVYKTYSYRGIYSKHTLANNNDFSLVKWYPVTMVNEANALLDNGKPMQAIELYNKALLFPVDKPEGNIYYNLSLAYGRLGDINNELINLKKAVDHNTEIVAAYSTLGAFYYKYGLLDLSLYAFKKASQKGQVSETVMRAIAVIEGVAAKDRNEFALLKAGEKIQANDINGAMIIYDYLLENHYKADIIYKNIGVYHFKTGDFKTALDYFKQSENETPDAGTAFYTAYTYYSLGMVKDAVSETESGITKFPDNKMLKNFYVKLKEIPDNGKGADSSDGQGRRDKDK